MKNILMIGTGGTIASEMTPSGLTPELNSKQLLSFVPRIGELCQVDCIQLYSLDSTNIRPAHWLGVAKTIQENYDRYDGFVIGDEPDAFTAAQDATDNATDDQAARKINAARKTLSKYKKILAKSLEQDNAEIADTAKAKILDSVAAIRNAGGIVGAAVTAELLTLGININDDAQA